MVLDLEPTYWISVMYHTPEGANPILVAMLGESELADALPWYFAMLEAGQTLVIVATVRT